jgi:hypothetical protein
MPQPLVDEPLILTDQDSVIAPVHIVGLPPRLAALGRNWQRKDEFHLTALTRARVVRWGGDDTAWKSAVAMAVGRSLAPVLPTDELRTVADDRSSLQTVIIMVQCAALADLFRDLHELAGLRLPCPPAHITLYSTDPAKGIGLGDRTELEALAPGLDEVSQRILRDAMSFADTFKV